MRKLALALAFSLVLTGGIWTGAGIQSEAAESQAINGLAVRTKEEVARKYDELMPDLSKSVTYVEEPSVEAPYALGQVSEEDLQAGLDAVNLVRYIAGLPDDITLNEDYNSLTQHASVVNAANDVLSHYPAQPEGMDSEFYSTGQTGARRSNIGAGYRNMADSVIRGYMDDSDSSNIDRVGHRRWILNPAMTETGFGYADSPDSIYGAYTAMYSTDRQRASYNVDYVAWPAAVTPTEIYRYTPAFSVSLNETYRVDEDQVTVTIHSQKENKDYVFGKNAGNDPAGQFYVSVGIYSNIMGMSGSTIIFMPDGHSFEKDDVLTISIDGITKGGADASFDYTVELFSAEEMLGDINKEVSSISVSGLTKTEYIEGENFSLDGGVVTVNYDNGTTEQVKLTDDMLAAAPDMSKIGTQTITVNYGGKTTSFTIEVRAKQLQKVELTVPGKIEYTEGEALDLTGGSLTLSYDNGTTENISLTADMVTGYDAAKTGKQTLTVSYGGFTETFTVTVNARQVTGIEWAAKPGKTTYVEGQELDLSGAYITVNYDNGTSEKRAVTEEMVSGYDKNSVGIQDITVTAEGRTLTFQVEVIEKVLTGIELTSNPSKMEYIVGQAFDISGAQLTLTYNDGEKVTVPVTTDMFTAPDMTTTGSKEIRISYEGFEVILTISVRDKQAVGIEMNTLPDQREYLENKVDQVFVADGGSINVLYDNETKETVDLTAAMCSVDLTTPGEKTVTVTYNGFTTTFTVTVNPKSVVEVEWLEEPTVLEMKEGTAFVFSGKLRATYDNGRSEEITLTEENAEIVNYNADQTGVQNVTISLKGYTLTEEMETALTFEIEVIPKVAVGIQIDKLPVTKYTVGDELDLTGLEVSIVYDNDTKEKISIEDVKIVAPDMSTAGEKEVGIMYQLNEETTFGASFKITVSEKTVNNPGDGNNGDPSTGNPPQGNGGSSDQKTDEAKDSGKDSGKNTAVQTGDETGFGMWIMLALVAAVTVGIVSGRKSNKNK